MSVGLKRVGILLIVVALQLIVIVGPFLEFAGLRKIFTAFSTFICVIAVLHLLRREMKPDYKIPWLVLVIISPVFGGIAYVIYGNMFGNKKIINHYNEYINQKRKALPLIDNYNYFMEDEKSNYKKQATYLDKFANAPTFGDTQGEYFPLGEDMWNKMLEELNKAEKFIFLEYFIVEEGLMWNSILDILEQKAKEGVEVRFAFDALGSLFTAPLNMVKELNNKGIQCIAFNDKMRVLSSKFNNRDHRKICVIDGNVGFTGGVNLADEYINEKVVYGHWKDTAIMLKGSGVWPLTLMFLTFWGLARKEEVSYDKYKPTLKLQGDGYYAPYTDYPADDEDVGETAYVNMINNAEKYVYITTPYLILDSIMVASLRDASKNGIDVRIITPGIPDKKMVYMLTKSYYKMLIDVGVKIYEYTPGFIHAKQFVSDDICGIIGTINLDYRSLTHHFEDAVWIYKSKIIKDIKEDYLDTIALCSEVTMEECLNISLFNRLIMPILRAFSSLL